MRDIDKWMPLWIGDYLADTTHLTAEAHGAYLLLIFAYWKNGGPLVHDEKNNRRRMQLNGVTRKHRNAYDEVMRFFSVTGGMLYHKRIDLEIKKAKESMNLRRDRTQKARDSKLCKLRENGSVAGMPHLSVTTPVTESVTETPSPSPSPSQKRDKNIARKIKPPTAPQSDEDDALFEQAKRHYPRKLGKIIGAPAAKVRFRKLSHADKVQFVQNCKHYRDSQGAQRLNGRYVRHFDGFVYDGRTGTEPWRDWMEPELSGALLNPAQQRSQNNADVVAAIVERVEQGEGIA